MWLLFFLEYNESFFTRSACIWIQAVRKGYLHLPSYLTQNTSLKNKTQKSPQSLSKVCCSGSGAPTDIITGRVFSLWAQTISYFISLHVSLHTRPLVSYYVSVQEDALEKWCYTKHFYHEFLCDCNKPCLFAIVQLLQNVCVCISVQQCVCIQVKWRTSVCVVGDAYV